MLTSLIFAFPATAYRLLKAIRVQPGLWFDLSFFLGFGLRLVVWAGEGAVMDSVGVRVLRDEEEP